MPDEPIEVIRGLYTEPDGRVMEGLCIVLDNQDGKWEVTTSGHYNNTVIKIKNGAKWHVEDYIDPETKKRKVRILCEGGKLNSLELDQSIRPTEKVYTAEHNAANDEWPGVKIFYTTPDDGHKPTIKIKAP